MKPSNPVGSDGFKLHVTFRLWFPSKEFIEEDETESKEFESDDEEECPWGKWGDKRNETNKYENPTHSLFEAGTFEGKLFCFSVHVFVLSRTYHIVFSYSAVAEPQLLRAKNPQSCPLGARFFAGEPTSEFVILHVPL